MSKVHIMPMEQKRTGQSVQLSSERSFPGSTVSTDQVHVPALIESSRLGAVTDQEHIDIHQAEQPQWYRLRVSFCFSCVGGNRPLKGSEWRSQTRQPFATGLDLRLYLVCIDEVSLHAKDE